MHSHYQEIGKSMLDRLRQPTSTANDNTFVDLSIRMPSIKGTANGHTWATPFFSRLALDASMPDAALQSLLRARSELGLATVGLAKHVPNATLEMGLNSGVDIVPVFIDEPIPFEALENAVAIEVEFFRASYDAKKANRRGRWASLLSSDLVDASQLGKRVELLRSASTQPNLIVGASIASSNVYEDVRFLSDMGFDTICLLSSVVTGLDVHERLELSPIELTIETALKAIKESGRTDVELMISGSIRDAEQAIRYLSMGVAGIGVDTYLQSHRPIAHSKQPEGFGAFLVDYASPMTSHDCWFEREFAKFVDDVSESLEFLGWSSLNELLRRNRKQ